MFTPSFTGRPYNGKKISSCPKQSRLSEVKLRDLKQTMGLIYLKTTEATNHDNNKSCLIFKI